MTSNDWYFGLDAGATQTRLYAHSKSTELDFELFGGPANVLRQGTKAVASELSCLINNALDKLSTGRLRGIHAGIAGASAPQIQEDLINRLRILVQVDHSFHLSVSHDGVIALGRSVSGKNGTPIYSRNR